MIFFQYNWSRSHHEKFGSIRRICAVLMASLLVWVQDSGLMFPPGLSTRRVGDLIPLIFNHVNLLKVTCQREKLSDSRKIRIIRVFLWNRCKQKA